jgi:putative FmdB family regulatory protein
MPLYEYRCKDCGTEFEKQLRFSEASQLPACPNCNSTQTRKKISSVVSFTASSDSSFASSSSSSCSTGGGFT